MKGVQNVMLKVVKGAVYKGGRKVFQRACHDLNMFQKLTANAGFFFNGTVQGQVDCLAQGLRFVLATEQEQPLFV